MARGRLFARLADAGRVTIISGPAGSGKTVLLRSWVDEAGMSESTAWVSLGRDKPDPEHFWISVLDGLRSTKAGSRVLREITPAPGLGGDIIAERLLEDLGSLENPLWLVIDDVHELGSGEALRQLALFAMRAPRPLRVVLLTRRDVRLGLHRLRLDGELTEVRADELRFSVQDARSLFDAAGTPLPDSALELLHTRTEGWAAGLRLAALSMAGRDDPERFAAEFSGTDRIVAEYLVDEVLDRLPDEFGKLLLRTSVLERVNGSLADLMTGASGGERMLDELDRANAFVVSLDSQRSWFRYHHLFADLLQLELRRTAPEEIPALHRRAADWFAQHGYPVEAVRHAQAGDDWALAARLLFDHWFGLWLDGRSSTAHELLAAFPPGTTTADAELASIAAVDELTGGSLKEAERYLALAARESPSVPEDRRGSFQVRVASARLSLARAGNDVTLVAQEAERLLRLLEADSTPPGLGEDPRTMTMLNLGIAGIWTGRRENAERYLEEALALACQIRRPFIELGAQAYLALLAVSRMAPLAEERSRLAIELAHANGWDDETFAGVAFAALGNITLWRGRLSEAEQWIEQAERALQVDVEPATGLMLRTTRGLLELVSGHHEHAMAALRAAKRLQAPLAVHSLAPFVDAHMLVAQVRNGEAHQVQAALAEMDTETLESLQMRVARAAFSLAQDQAEDAVAALAPILENPDARPQLPLEDAAAVMDVRRMIQALLLGALALDALGNPGDASRALERALDLAEPDGLLLPFLLFPAADLLERHGRFRTAHASLVAEILSELADKPPASALGKPEPLLEPLSESEVRVLRYLPTNLSAPEIAGELYVAVTTVKTHIQHIYGKLGTHRRAEAVERARALGLLAPTWLRRG